MIEEMGKWAFRLMIAGACFYVVSLAWGYADRTLGLTKWDA